MRFVTERFPTTETMRSFSRLNYVLHMPPRDMRDPIITGYFTTMGMFEVEIGLVSKDLLLYVN